MRILTAIALMFTCLSSQAYEFSYEYAHAFKSSAAMKAEVQKQFDAINMVYLRPHDLEVQLDSVTKDFSVHTIKGRMTGINCRVSTAFYKNVATSRSEYPKGVEVATLSGIGLILPVNFHDIEEMNARWDASQILLPACLK